MSTQPEKTWNCGLYVRVSTDNQASKEFNSLDTQKDVLLTFVKEKDEKRAPDATRWRVVKIYEEAKSAKDTNRPRFREMLQDIENGLINMIVFIRLDRFSRSLHDFLNLQEFLKAHHCRFISKYDPELDTSTAHGEFIINLFLSLAQLERRLISERVKVKIEWRAKQGLWNGGQVLGYDLSTDPKGKLIPNTEEARIVQFLFETYCETKSLRLTAKQANTRGYRTKQYTSRTGKMHGGNNFTKGVIYHILQNSVYKGKVQLKDKNFNGKHKPIIAKNLWDTVQESLTEDARHRPSDAKPRTHIFMLEDLGFCGLCGSSLMPHYTKTRGEYRYYYRCRAKYNGGKGDDCTLPVIQANQLEDLISKEIRKIANSHELLATALEYAKSVSKNKGSGNQARLRAKQGELKKLQANRQNLLLFIQAGGFKNNEKNTPEEIVTNLEDIRQKIKGVEEQISDLKVSLKSEKKSIIDPEAIQDSLTFFDIVYDFLSHEEKATLIKTFVQRFTYTPEEVQIYIYNDLLDEKTRENAAKALKRPELPMVTTGSSGFLNRQIKLGILYDYRTFWMTPSPELKSLLQELENLPIAG